MGESDRGRDAKAGGASEYMSELAEVGAKFAEGATALVAASIRMQMMFLEQMQQDLREFSDALGGADPEDPETGDRESRRASADD